MPKQFQSTHSRGVRLPFCLPSRKGTCYFNPRTHEECDSINKRRTTPDKYFNPRTHEECDMDNPSMDIPGMISIHALTRSATLIMLTVLFQIIFQSTHSRGVRHFSQVIYFVKYQFQSTHSRGVRRVSFCSDRGSKLISIHALTRSATLRCLVLK